MPEITSFEAFGLPEEIMRGVREMGYTSPTPVQAAAIPEVLKNKDLLVQAKTGSGKTLAFGLPLLARLDHQSPDTQVLVITPTRELAIQVATEVAKAGKYAGVLVSAIYGGTKMDGQLTDLAWSSVIVGTPGRLRDHLSRGNLKLDHCATVVLDEADEMLDMGFKDDIEFLLSALPRPRTTLLFSATFPKPIEAIAHKYMHKPEKIAVSTGLVTPTDITHRVLKVTEAQRVNALIQVLEREMPNLALVFCKRKSETGVVARKLKAAGIRAGSLNGDMTQEQRIATLDQFKRGELNVLVATDVAARGLDISGITHVINASVPQDTETYVHRSGRTGRAGRKGICITLVTPQEDRYFTKIQQDLAAGARLAQAMASREAKPPAAPEAPPERQRPARRPEPESRERIPRAESPDPARQPRAARPAPEPARSAARPLEQRPVEPAPRLKPSVEAVLRSTREFNDQYRTIARDLLEVSDAETLVAALLGQTPHGPKLLREHAPFDEVPAASRRRGGSRSGSRSYRTQRRPSMVVYGE